MKPIMPKSVAFTAEISEDELRQRLVAEVLESIGALNEDGTPAPGVEAVIVRGEARKGGYRVTIKGPMPARLLLPQDPAPGG